MRLRIQTQVPLPELKAWFIPDVPNVPQTIYNLKEALCQRVQALKDGLYQGQSLILLLDDFELLDDTPFSAVRDGDLVCIKLSPLVNVAHAKMDVEKATTRERKRKRSPSVHKSISIPGRSVRTPTTLPSSKKHAITSIDDSGSESDSSSSSSSSSSSTSSSSSSSSSSTSSTSSSSSSSSSSSTSSATSSPPQLLSSKPGKKIPPAPSAAPKSLSGHVPPGLGKSSTHSRNQRRRKRNEHRKGLHLTGGMPPAPPKGSSDANTLPLGTNNKKRRPEADATAKAITPTSVPLPTSPTTHDDASSSTATTNLPPSKSSTPLSIPRKRVRTQRDRDGPASDVASALNNAFGQNADSGEYIPGELTTDVYITKDQVMMGSLRNKNKKKGFKLSMANPIPQKIVFSSGTGGESSTLNDPLPNPPPEAQLREEDEDMDFDGSFTYPSPSETRLPPPRLIPPSEIQECGQLPTNMFVTSVDVEAGMWDNNNNTGKASKRKNKKKQSQQLGIHEYSYADRQDEWYEKDQHGSTAVEDASVILSYSEPGSHNNDNSNHLTAQGTPTSGGSEVFDWDKAERVWDKSVLIIRFDQLTVGGLVGWKALAINPRTFSPEFLLSVAQVVKLPESPPSDSGVVVVRLLSRPSGEASQAALAFGLNESGDVDEEGGPEGNEETLEWSHVVGSQWRVLEL